jgi:hypothetical protein
MIPEPIKSMPIVDAQGRPTEIFWSWLFQINQLQIITGTGSPEGAVSAQELRLYEDTDAAAGSNLYIKRLSDIGGDRTQGWRLV